MEHNTNKLKQDFCELLSSATNEFKRKLHEKEAEFEAQKRKGISDIVAEQESKIKKLRGKQYYLKNIYI